MKLPAFLCAARRTATVLAGLAMAASSTVVPANAATSVSVCVAPTGLSQRALVSGMLAGSTKE